MATGDIELLLGARGWNYANWQESFYPDGLPEDWRFSYYSNEFSSVLVPWEYLHEASRGQTLEWLDSTDSDFVFFAELALHLTWEESRSVIEPLSPQLGGVCLREVYPQRTASLDMSAVESLVSNASELAPLIMDADVLDARLQTVVSEYNPGCYWRPDETGVTPCAASVALAETTLSTKHQPRVLKKIIEDCCSVQGPTTIGFFIGGQMPDIEDLRNAVMIWQMLG
jgi:hypothetical protein